MAPPKREDSATRAFLQSAALPGSAAEFGRSGKSYQSCPPWYARTESEPLLAYKEESMSKTRNARVIGEGKDAGVQQHHLVL